MTRGVRKYLVGSVVLAALIAVAGCTHFLMADRDPWRHDAEAACLASGVPDAIPGRVRISAISGPGACGIDYPLKVSAIGVSGPLGYDDAPMTPPGSIPNGAGPRQWPGVESSPLPPPPQPSQYGAPQYAPPPAAPPPYSPPAYGQSQYGPPQYQAPSPQYDPPQYDSPQAGAPMSLSPPGEVSPSSDDDEEETDAPHPYYNAPNNAGLNNPVPGAPTVDVPSSLYSPRPMMAPGEAQQGAAPRYEPIPPPPLGPPAPPPATAGPVQLQPAATLACPLVSALDKWIAGVVQPAALRWFGRPVVEIKQIGSYSCRGMINGNPNAPISEHAFGNAIDIAEFDLADGHRISVQYGWHGSPEEQGFLHDVQGGACRDFTTVLAPGANVYHYNHIHVDLMRRKYRPYICEPSAIPGEVAAARARERYATHYGRPDVTGSIRSKKSLSYSDDDENMPLAVPGDD
jgi:hypothetical protein